MSPQLQDQERPGTSFPSRDGFFPALAILVLTSVLSLFWSGNRLLWNDEFLSFYGDSASTLRDTWNVQLRTPISLDPPTYHLLSHLSMDVIGRNAIALRLPALAGFLLLQICLFLFVRRLAGARAALLAMALPLCTASFRYSVEGRPYGLLLGLYALALLSWYTAATRRDNPIRDAQANRLLPLVTLTASIALAITSHYFGVLILIPITLGELARIAQRRRLDGGIAAALIAGLSSIAIVLPFQKALTPYRRHYYISGVNLHNISQGYREIFIRYNAWSLPLQRLTALLLAAGTLTLAWAAFKRYRHRPATEPAYLWLALLSFAALPFFGYLFGKFVTHTMEVRYVIAALIPFAVVLALLLAPRLRTTRTFTLTLAATLLFAITINAFQIAGERRTSAAMLASFNVPATLHNELAAHPDERLYTQSLGDFFLDTYYAQDPLIRQRMSLLYDADREIQYLHHDTNAITVVYLAQFTPLHVSTYADFLTQPTPLLLDYRSGWEWVGEALSREHHPVHPLGVALHGGRLERLATTSREPSPRSNQHPD